jgi:hypothetical protein
MCHIEMKKLIKQNDKMAIVATVPIFL